MNWYKFEATYIEEGKQKTIEFYTQVNIAKQIMEMMDFIPNEWLELQNTDIIRTRKRIQFKNIKKCTKI